MAPHWLSWENGPSLAELSWADGPSLAELGWWPLIGWAGQRATLNNAAVGNKVGNRCWEGHWQLPLFNHFLRVMPSISVAHVTLWYASFISLLSVVFLFQTHHFRSSAAAGDADSQVVRSCLFRDLWWGSRDLDLCHRKKFQDKMTWGKVRVY